AYSYSAAVAEVDVDPETGLVAVERIWIAHDIGRSINPALVMGQVEGSVYMGLGEALMEAMEYRGNRGVVHKFPSMLEYKSPTTMEMCDVVPISAEKVLKAIKSADKRYGPTKTPLVEWHEPLRVAPPWEGGDGRADNDPKHVLTPVADPSGHRYKHDMGAD